MIPYYYRPYRPCVGIALVNKDNLVFVGTRIDNPKNHWQMPQGGIDEGESEIEAGFREMEEEIGTRNAELLSIHSKWIPYDIPEGLADKIWQGQFRGQEQKWLLFRFLGNDSEIEINTLEPEFNSWKWVSPEEVVNSAIFFKRRVYRQVLSEFGLLNDS